MAGLGEPARQEYPSAGKLSSADLSSQSQSGSAHFVDQHGSSPPRGFQQQTLNTQLQSLSGAGTGRQLAPTSNFPPRNPNSLDSERSDPSQEYRRPSLGSVVEPRQRKHSIGGRSDASTTSQVAAATTVRSEDALLIPEFVSRQMLGSASSMINEAANNLEQLHAMLRARQAAVEADRRNDGGANGPDPLEVTDTGGPIKPEVFASGLGEAALEELDRLRSAMQHLHQAFATSGILKVKTASPNASSNPSPSTQPVAESPKAAPRRPSLFRMMGGGGETSKPARPQTAPSESERVRMEMLLNGRSSLDSQNRPAMPQNVQQKASNHSFSHARKGSGDSTSSSNFSSSFGFNSLHSRSNSHDSTNGSSVDLLHGHMGSEGKAEEQGTSHGASHSAGQQVSMAGAQLDTQPSVYPNQPAAGVSFVRNPFGVAQGPSSLGTATDQAQAWLQEQQQHDDGFAPRLTMPPLASGAPEPRLSLRRPSRWAQDDAERIRWENDSVRRGADGSSPPRPSVTAPLSFRRNPGSFGSNGQGPSVMRGRLASVPDVNLHRRPSAVTGTTQWQQRKMSLPGGSLTSRMATAGADNNAIVSQEPEPAPEQARPFRDLRGRRSKTALPALDSPDDGLAACSKRLPVAPHIAPAPASRFKTNSGAEGQTSTQVRGPRPTAPSPPRSRTWGYRCSVIEDASQDEEDERKERECRAEDEHKDAKAAQPRTASARGQLQAPVLESPPETCHSVPHTASTIRSDCDDGSGGDVRAAKDDDDGNDGGALDQVDMVLSEGAIAKANESLSSSCEDEEKTMTSTVGTTSCAAQWNRWVRSSISAASGCNDPRQAGPEPRGDADDGKCSIPPVAPSTTITSRRRPSVIVGGEVHDVPVRSPIDHEGYAHSSPLGSTSTSTAVSKYGFNRRPSDVIGTGTSMGTAIRATANARKAKATLMHKSSMFTLRE